MKLLILGILINLLTVACLQAQNLKIRKTDGSMITIPLNTIDSITFVESGSPFVCGTSTVTDDDGNIYNTVQIGNQCWMKENLKVGTMVNGSVEQTNNGIIEKYCYNNDPANCDVYGGLYQWYEMMKYSIIQPVQGICMTGWHLPTDEEWITFLNHLGGELVAGGKMKTTGTIEEGTGLWNSPNTGATNESGFLGLPAGHYNSGSSYGQGEYSYFWSASQFSSNDAWYLGLSFSNSYLGRGTNDQSRGFSVRCLKN